MSTSDVVNRVGVLSDTLDRVIVEHRMFPRDLPAIREIIQHVDEVSKPSPPKDVAQGILGVLEPLADRFNEFEAGGRALPPVLDDLQDKITQLRAFVDAA